MGGIVALLVNPGPLVLELCRKPLRRSSKNGLQAVGRTAIIPDLVRMQALPAVQQRCSNPGKSPEMLGKAPSSECCYLQAFCTHLKTPANLRAALAWRRPGVRVPSGPPHCCFYLHEKRERSKRTGPSSGPF
jgi:hypothetical protein